MDLSILICTHNSNSRLKQCLQHLVMQQVSKVINWEILVCDYISQDGTVQTVKDFAANKPLLNIRLVKIETAGKTPALIAGFAAAKGEAICIVDDDNFVDHRYVETAHDLIFKHPQIGVIGAQGLPLFANDSVVPDWFELFKGVYAVGHQFSERGFTHGDRNFFWGAGSVFRKSAWVRALQNGFVPLLNPSRGSSENSFMPGFTGGEDPEMCFAVRMAGYKLWYEPDLKYHHLIPAARLTKKFIYDTTRNVHVVEPYLRLFLSYVIPNQGFRNRLKIIIWQHWYLHMVYIILSSTKKLIVISNASHERKIRMRFIFICAQSQISGLLNMYPRFKSLKNNFKKISIKLGEK